MQKVLSRGDWPGGEVAKGQVQNHERERGSNHWEVEAFSPRGGAGGEEIKSKGDFLKILENLWI